MSFDGRGLEAEVGERREEGRGEEGCKDEEGGDEEDDGEDEVYGDELLIKEGFNADEVALGISNGGFWAEFGREVAIEEGEEEIGTMGEAVTTLVVVMVAAVVVLDTPTPADDDDDDDDDDPCFDSLVRNGFDGTRFGGCATDDVATTPVGTIVAVVVVVVEDIEVDGGSRGVVKEEEPTPPAWSEEGTGWWFWWFSVDPSNVEGTLEEEEGLELDPPAVIVAIFEADEGNNPNELEDDDKEGGFDIDPFTPSTPPFLPDSVIIDEDWPVPDARSEKLENLFASSKCNSASVNTPILPTPLKAWLFFRVLLVVVEEEVETRPPSSSSSLLPNVLLGPFSPSTASPLDDVGAKDVGFAMIDEVDEGKMLFVRGFS
jgi:hypothetical protein